MASDEYVSRGGDKLAAALDHFKLEVAGLVCADLGSHVGGFVDCLVRRGAARVFAVDTAYGTLAWKLRQNERVVAYERTNAMHVQLPEAVDLVTIDVGWTPQERVLPQVFTLIKPAGRVITLIKPHYEADKAQLVKGVLPVDLHEKVVGEILERIKLIGWAVRDTCESHLRGHGGNREVLALLDRA